MAIATRTLNPLHFEDMEPKRFEDLVRALLYDFKNWQKLEGTGRSGSDDGFDARGWEAADVLSPAEDDRDSDGEPTVDFLANSKLWLVQCKREKSIGPTKLIAYLDSILPAERDNLDGLIFVACCDFSKTARDKFREWCIGAGIAEYHLWGKTELEDSLLLPKNDSLLFAFMGISLVVRRRSLKTELRARLATKRKIIKIVGSVGDNVHKAFIFRDPADDKYPQSPAGAELKPRNGAFNYNWFARTVVAVRHDGVIVQFRDAMAYLADDGITWDATRIGDQAVPDHYDNPWEHPLDFDEEHKRSYAARYFWNEIPESNRARMESWGFIPFDSMLAIDEDGDENSRLPVIFVSFEGDGPFSWGNGRVRAGDRDVPNDPATRISYFPVEFPEPPPRVVQVADD